MIAALVGPLRAARAPGGCRGAAVTAYEIRITGCDESTVFAVDLDDTEAAAVERVAAASREASPYDCFPTMTVTAAIVGPLPAPKT